MLTSEKSPMNSTIHSPINFKPGKLHTAISLDARLSQETSSYINGDVFDDDLLATYPLPILVQGKQCVRVILRTYWLLVSLELAVDWGLQSKASSERSAVDVAHLVC